MPDGFQLIETYCARVPSPYAGFEASGPWLLVVWMVMFLPSAVRRGDLCFVQHICRNRSDHVVSVTRALAEGPIAFNRRSILHRS